MILQNPNKRDTILYDVRDGDSLRSIIKNYYGIISPQRQKSIIEQIMLENPEIKNPNLIYPGQIFVMDIPRQYCASPAYPPPIITGVDAQTLTTLSDDLEKKSTDEKQLISLLAPIMLGTGATALTTVKQSFNSNAPLLSEMLENYNDYKVDKLTKGQYDYRRRRVVNRLSTQLGPLNRLLNGSKPAGEVLRIEKTKGLAPDHNIHKQAKDMRKLSKLAAGGGVILSAVGLGIACNQMANTDDKQKKNVILVESVGGLVGGALFGVAVTVILIGTPVGWVAALAIGVGSVAASHGGGLIGKHAYTTYGTHIDLATLSNINTLCR